MAKWRNEVTIKKYIGSGTTDSDVLTAVTGILPELQYVKKKEEKSVKSMKTGVYRENVEYAVDQLEEVIDEFVWIKEAIEKKKNMNEFGHAIGVDAFNEYLEGLYDVADMVVKPGTLSEHEKFMWIK